MFGGRIETEAELDVNVESSTPGQKEGIFSLLGTERFAQFVSSSVIYYDMTITRAVFSFYHNGQQS